MAQATRKKRQAQDATRKYDVAPLRRRIEKLEHQVAQLIWIVVPPGKRKAFAQKRIGI